MKIPLCIPSRCTAELPQDLNKEHLICQPKLDGSRYVFYIGSDPYGRHDGNTLLSRRISVVDNKHVDRTFNLPHITGLSYAGLDGTVLDGEVMAKDFLGTNSVMNSSPRLAVQKQKESGFLDYFVFDVMFFKGIDVRGRSLLERKKILEVVIKRMNNENVKAIPVIKGDIVQAFVDITSAGGEGLIIKDLRMGYGIGWSKLKRCSDISCIITGFKPGNGKYKDSVGSIAVSVYNEGRLVEIGFASGFSDSIRSDMTKNPDRYLNRVVDIFAHEISKSNRLRHPTFARLRDDVNATDCTLSKVKDDMRNNVKKGRFKGDFQR